MWEGCVNILVVFFYYVVVMYISMIMIYYWDVFVVLGIGNVFLSFVLVMEYFYYVEVDVVILLFVVLEELSYDIEFVEVFVKLEFVGFGGGECLFFQCFLRVMVVNDFR